MKTTIFSQLTKIGKNVCWLSRKLKIEEGIIAKWQRGQRPQSFALMRRVANLLLCEPSDLWRGVVTPINWERRRDAINVRLNELHYKYDAKLYADLCTQKAAASVHIYIINTR